MSDYKLTYFNGRARAELTRLIFAVSGQKYNDERFQWGDNSYKPDSPLGQLPYLTVNGVKLPQSIAIARFAAKKANLYGSDDLEQAKTDAVIDTLSDVQNIYYKKVFNGKPEDRDLNVKSFLTDDAPTHLGNLEKLIKLWGSNGYSVGSSLKWSDLQIYAVTYELKTLDSNLLSKYPAVEAVVKSVESNPKVAEYLKTRPDAAF